MTPSQRPPLWKSIPQHMLQHIDWPLLTIVGLISTIGFITLFSAGQEFPWRIEGQIRNYIAALCVMFLFANIPLDVLKRISLPVYIIGVALLLATLLFGVSVKGATRWLNLGIMRIQPSEIMKLGLPMMLAWYFSTKRNTLSNLDWFVSGLLLVIPVSFILKQPDLGTSILVFVAGFSVVFFAGLPWRWLGSMALTFVCALPIVWMLMHDYQRTRVLILLDPSRDPLGSGFHILQALIAIGSGGMFGKGWMQGTQAALDFIPERTSDFIFAVYSEEFGWVGNCILIFLFFCLVARSAVIAANAKSIYGRLLAGAISIIFFSYSFVNIGMVSGSLPVVGVPLPFMSYGGTALVILGMCTGILMSIHASRKKDEF